MDLLEASKDFIGFRAQFNAFLSASRAITFALQKEGSHVAGFKAWYAEKQDEMREDELLRYMHTRRTGDFHEGDASLAPAGMYIDHFSTQDAGPAPEPGATMEIGAAGINWVLGAGTARERRVPVTRGGSWQTRIALLEAPTVHLGKPIANANPHVVCSLTLSYFEALVHEARTREWAA